MGPLSSTCGKEKNQNWELTTTRQECIITFVSCGGRRGGQLNILGICIVVVRQTLTLFVGVRFSHPQPKTAAQKAAGFSGHSAVGSAPGSGLGGRGFKSRCSDQRNYPHGCLKNQAFMRVFLFVFVLYGPRRTPAKRPEARLNGLQKMGGQPAKTPPRRHQSAGRGTFYVPDRPGRVSRDRGNSGRLEGLPGRGVIRPIKQIKEKSEPFSHRKKARLFCKRKRSCSCSVWPLT